MDRHRIIVASAAVILAALGVPGCSRSEPSTPPPAAPSTSAAPGSTAPASALPSAEALTDVLYRLVDPQVPGADKLSLIEGAQPTAADTLDKFVTALKDNGYLPLSFDATDIAWSEREPGNAAANVDVGTANPDRPGFSFPMEFHSNAGSWQLSAQTAEMLLALQTPGAGSSPTSEPNTSPTR